MPLNIMSHSKKASAIYGPKAMKNETSQDNTSPRARWNLIAWIGASGLLMLPLVAMQFTNEVAWDEWDFILMGAMLFTACGLFELATRMSGSRAYHAGVGVAVATAFLLVWINLAVGIIGTEDDPANLMFVAVIAIAILGAIIARFQPRGMALAMVAAAIAEALVAVLVLFMGHVTFILTAFFAGMWLVSAWLFRKAAREQISAS